MFCLSGWHSILPSPAAPVSPELGHATCVLFFSSRYDHITPLLHQLHWLTAPERIQFKLAVLVYKCLCQHGTAPSYFTNELEYTADFETRRCLRSSSSLSLNVRRTRLSTVSDRAFPVAAARTWNSLSRHVTSAPSMSVSEVASRLSSSGVHSHDIYRNFCNYSACTVTVVIFGHLLTYLLSVYSASLKLHGCFTIMSLKVFCPYN